MGAKLTRNIDLEIALEENVRLKKMLEAVTIEARKHWEELESLKFKHSMTELEKKKFTTRK